MEAVIFWIFSLLAICGAVLLVFHKNPIHSALSLILTLFCTASIFVLLHAGFIAVMQILVYAGAIMVLFVFVIMLLNLQREELGLRRHALKKALAAALVLIMGLKFAAVMAVQNTVREPLPDSFGSIENVGVLIFTDFFLPFEAVAILLLAAIVGAVVVAKTRV